MLATEPFNAKNGLSPFFMNEMFVENAQHCCNLRKKTEFKRNNVKRVYKGTETLTFLDLELKKLCKTALKK